MSDDKAPMTALEAVESVAASSAAAPAETSTAQPPSADATVPPATETDLTAVNTTPSPDGKPGVPPEDRWPSILENARAKAAEDAKAAALAEWRQTYGWAETIKPEQLHEMATFYDRAGRDPVAHTVELLNELVANPQYSAQVRSHAARILGHRANGASPADADIEPDIPVMDEQGNVVTRAYSAEAMRQFVQRELQKAIHPLSDDLKTRREQEAHAHRLREQTEYVTRETTRIGSMLSGLPKYAEHTEPIKARIAELAKTDAHSTPGEIAYRAYVDVVLPKLSAATQADVLDSLKQKAGAQMEKPSGGSASPLPRPRNVRDLEKTIAHLAGTMR